MGEGSRAGCVNGEVAGQRPVAIPGASTERGGGAGGGVQGGKVSRERSSTVASAACKWDVCKKPCWAGYGKWLPKSTAHPGASGQLSAIPPNRGPRRAEGQHTPPRMTRAPLRMAEARLAATAAPAQAAGGRPGDGGRTASALAWPVQKPPASGQPAPAAVPGLPAHALPPPVHAPRQRSAPGRAPSCGPPHGTCGRRGRTQCTCPLLPHGARL